MASKRPKPLTGDELRNLRDRFGSDRLARLLLWEIARLRSVVLILYRQICRLSYRRPDEVGPGLDEETEAQVLGNLFADKSRTILIVAHRPSALQQCDRVLRLEGGRIVGDG